jgi:hypothetical protein
LVRPVRLEAVSGLLQALFICPDDYDHAPECERLAHGAGPRRRDAEPDQQADEPASSAF